MLSIQNKYCYRQKNNILTLSTNMAINLRLHGTISWVCIHKYSEFYIFLPIGISKLDTGRRYMCYSK
jgi:hypothetical protein